SGSSYPPAHHSFPTRRSSDLARQRGASPPVEECEAERQNEDGSDRAEHRRRPGRRLEKRRWDDVLDLRRAGERVHREREGTESRSEEHTSELQSRENLVCRLL